MSEAHSSAPEYETSEAIAILIREQYRVNPLAFREKAEDAAKRLRDAVTSAVKATTFRTVQEDSGGFTTIGGEGRSTTTKVRLVCTESGITLQTDTTGEWVAGARPEIEYDPTLDIFVGPVIGGAKAPVLGDPKANSRRNAVSVVVEAIIAALSRR